MIFWRCCFLEKGISSQLSKSTYIYYINILLITIFFVQFPLTTFKTKLVFSEIKAYLWLPTTEVVLLTGKQSTVLFQKHLKIVKKIQKFHIITGCSQTALPVSELHLGLPQTSAMKNFASKVNSFQPLTIVVKLSIPDVCRSHGCFSEYKNFVRAITKSRNTSPSAPFSIHVPYFFQYYSSFPKFLDHHIIYR